MMKKRYFRLMLTALLVLQLCTSQVSITVNDVPFIVKLMGSPYLMASMLFVADRLLMNKKLSLYEYQELWGNKNVQLLPQYKYFAIPLYKKLGGNENPLFSVPITFIVTDFMFHHFSYWGI